MSAILTFLSPILSRLFDLIPDPTQRAQAMQDIMAALQSWDAQQNAVNAEEAKNPNVFVSGWRPAIGWTCALALFYQYLIVPFASWGLSAAQAQLPPFPVLDENLWQLVVGMLGMGGMRTFEKIKGVG